MQNLVCLEPLVWQMSLSEGCLYLIEITVFKITSNINPPYGPIPISSLRSLYFALADKILCRLQFTISPMCSTCHTLLITLNLITFIRILLRVQIMIFFVRLFFCFCYSFSLRLEYSLQYPVLKHPWSTRIRCTYIHNFHEWCWHLYSSCSSTMQW
jgi:hypothetical protein